MSTWLSIALLARLAAPAPVETFEYTIKKGDTCASISREVYGDRSHYELIHRNNRWLGAQMPHHLEPGQTLVLPKTVPADQPDAEVTAARRRVEARSPDTSDWSSASLGLGLYRGWRVNTHDRASAEITFRDDSRIQMRENTLVIIYGGTRGKSRRSTTEAVLDRGALRSRLGAYTGGKADQEVTVTTPSAVAEFSGGVGLVTVDDDGTSRVANHGEGKASVRSSGKKKRRRVGVKPKMGSKVARGAAPTKPKPLPPTPAWIERGATTFLAAGDRGGTIYAEWGAIAGARSYRVEIARQPDGRELVVDQTVGAEIHRFEARQLPPGDYYASVAAIDDDAFESPPSVRRKLSVVPVYLLTPGAAPVADGGDDPNEEATTATRPTPVLRGTRLDVPDALRCRIDDGEPSREPALDTVGEHTVSCLTADDQPVPGFTVSVMDVRVAAAQHAAIVRGQTSSARFTIDAEIPLPRRIWADAPEGVLVGSPAPAPDGDGWTVPVHADVNAAANGPAELRIMADAGGEAVELGRIALAIEAPAQPSATAVAPAEPRPERHMLEAGLFGGILVPSTRHDLFQEAYAAELDYQAFDPIAGSVGLRLGYYPIRWVGLELENNLGLTRTRRGGERATLIAIRGHVLAQMPWRITPTLHLGGGALGVNAPRVLGRDFDRTLHFGGGVKFFATRWLAVRLDIRDVLSEANGGGVAHSAELLIGVGGVLGRSSATARRAKSR